MIQTGTDQTPGLSSIVSEI